MAKLNGNRTGGRLAADVVAESIIRCSWLFADHSISTVVRRLFGGGSQTLVQTDRRTGRAGLGERKLSTVVLSVYVRIGCGRVGRQTGATAGLTVRQRAVTRFALLLFTVGAEAAFQSQQVGVQGGGLFGSEMTNFGCIHLTNVVHLLSTGQIEFGQLGDDLIGTVAVAAGAGVLRLVHSGTLVR